MSIYFSSELIALENARNPIKIDTLDQLVAYQNIKILVNEKSAQHAAILKYHAEFEKRLEFVGYHEMFSRNFISKIAKNNMVMISSGFDIKNIMLQYQSFSLHQSEDKNPSMYMISFVIRKNICENIKSKFSKILEMIDQHGIMQQENKQLASYHKTLRGFEFNLRSSSNVDEELVNTDRFGLTLSQLQFIFLQYDLGLVISFICFLNEYLTEKRDRLLKIIMHHSLKF